MCFWDTQGQAAGEKRLTSVPTLMLNACDDPLLTPESFPVAEADGNVLGNAEIRRAFKVY
jgi:predicted alpha/beta-fold hydrolase